MAEKASKREMDPIEIGIDPGAPVELFNKLLKAVAALTERGHTVTVFARPRPNAAKSVTVSMLGHDAKGGAT